LTSVELREKAMTTPTTASAPRVRALSERSRAGDSVLRSGVPFSEPGIVDVRVLTSSSSVTTRGRGEMRA
jgi:hypothetical protein